MAMSDFKALGSADRLTKAAVASLYVAVLVFLFGLRSGLLKAIVFGLAAGLEIVAAVILLRSQSVRETAGRGLRRIALPAIAAGLYVAALWISGLRIGGLREVEPAAIATVLLGLLFLVLPVLVRDRNGLLFSVRAYVGAGLATVLISWGLLMAELLAGLGWGVARPAKLVYEKKAIMEALGLPFILKGPFLHPNVLGMLAAGLIAGLMILRAGERRIVIRRLETGALVLCGLTIAASLSIIAAIPALFTAAGMTLFARSRIWDRGIRAAAVAGILFFNFAAAFGLRLDFLLRLPIRSWVRIELWTQAVASIRANPTWGIGQSGVNRLLPFHLSSHNTMIEAALGRGIPAMILASLILIWLLLRLPPDRDPLSRGILHLVLAAVFLQAFEVLPLGSLWIMSADMLALALPLAALAGASPTALDSPPGPP
ncbi:MAG: hypothetical protein PHI34_08210 [Acidobacteriota bacterium]|nr:hypothetical protein [Acidobacteriota bacterium]